MSVWASQMQSATCSESLRLAPGWFSIFLVYAQWCWKRLLLGYFQLGQMPLKLERSVWLGDKSNCHCHPPLTHSRIQMDALLEILHSPFLACLCPLTTHTACTRNTCTPTSLNWTFELNCSCLYTSFNVYMHTLEFYNCWKTNSSLL